MWKKAHILYLIIIYRQIIWFWGGLARLVRLEYLTENSLDTKCRTGYNIVYSVQARLLFLFSMKQRPEFFYNFGWPDYLFYLQKLPDPLPTPARNQLVVPKTNQEINEPSYEMVGVKITVTIYGQNKSYFWHFFSCWFFIFFSDNSKCFHRNGFEMYILIIIYTVCTCDTLVPTRILNSEISWFCFDFPKWGPVSFIITDFNVFVQFFE
jgi:hypothetical protein